MTMKLWYNALHRITGSMAMTGINELHKDCTKEQLEAWSKDLTSIAKEMKMYAKQRKAKKE